MRFFYFFSKQYYPLVFLIGKLVNQDEMTKFESLTDELFKLLIEKNNADDKSIVIFSVIKDWDRKTENLIKPTPKSDQEILEKVHNNTPFLNNIIINILKSTDCGFYIEINENKVKIYNGQIGLTSLAQYYKV
jgi:hypothetical protein